MQYTLTPWERRTSSGSGPPRRLANLGITTRTLYRLIDGGELPAFKFGRVIRLKQADVEAFVEGARIEPGTLEHLYPERRDTSVSEPIET